MSQYHIFQIKSETSYEFRGWATAKPKFSFNDYQNVYSGEVMDQITFNGKSEKCNESDEKVLEDLFVKFNINHPSDFKGHSLSVSDIVLIERKNTRKYYYCDEYGWTDITASIEKENIFNYVVYIRQIKNGELLGTARLEESFYCLDAAVIEATKNLLSDESVYRIREYDERISRNIMSDNDNDTGKIVIDYKTESRGN